MSKAAAILEAGAGHMKDRAKTYDNPQGERSMESCVRMFNTLTGHDLTAEQGWHFMTCLKMVRSQQGGYRADNYEDGAAYFALAGEQAEQDRGRNVNETDADYDHLTPQVPPRDFDPTKGQHMSIDWFRSINSEALPPAPTVEIEDTYGVCESPRPGEVVWVEPDKLAALVAAEAYKRKALGEPRWPERAPIKRAKGYKHKCQCGIQFFNVKEHTICICGQPTHGEVWRG